MKHQSSLFSQILSLIPRKKFDILVSRHKAERHAKGFSCWTQFVAMLFCQLAQAKSLREICSGLRICLGKLNHLGLKSAPKRSTLSYANAHRPWRLFRNVYFELLELCRSAFPGKPKRFRFRNKLLSFDATLIELCASIFDWAKFRKTKGAVKLHTLLDHDGYLPTYVYISEGKKHEVNVARTLKIPPGSVIVVDRGCVDYELFYYWTKQGVWFVTRLKANAKYRVIKRLPVPTGGNVLRDEVIEFTGYNSRRKCPVMLRRVVVRDEENEREVVLLSNNFKFSARTIGEIYRERWQIEIFFKELKQHLKIKTFVGTSANAIHIQIWTALIAMLLLKYLKYLSKYNWSLSNLIALIRWNLFTYRDLWSWLNDPFEEPPKQAQPVQLKLPFLDSTNEVSKEIPLRGGGRI